MTRTATHKIPARAAASQARGASQSRASHFSQLQSWWSHNRSSARSSFERLVATPMQTLMTSMVVAIALALPATLMVALDNVERVGNQWDATPKITVYLHVKTLPQGLEQLQQSLKSLPQVQSLHYISPDEALKNFQQQSGFGDVLQILDNNPLPPTIIITPASLATSPEQLQALADVIAKENAVEQVEIDLKWVERLQALMHLGRKMVTGLTLILSLGVLIALGNTIRLAIESRRDEIIVIKLVGGTDGFVRRPFLYTGAWYGLFGGLLACALVTITIAFLAGPVDSLASSYQSHFQLHGLNFEGFASLIIISTGLGLIGAWLAVGRHLSAIEPK